MANISLTPEYNASRNSTPRTTARFAQEQRRPEEDLADTRAGWTDEKGQARVAMAERMRAAARFSELEDEMRTTQITKLLEKEKPGFVEPRDDMPLGSTTVFGYPLRKPYQSELNFFKSNPTVTGMAAEDNSIILNPYSGLNEKQKMSVATNEAIRLFLKNKSPSLSFKITEDQKKKFAGTEYGKPENINKLRETILARIIAEDPSAGDYTDEQKAEAERIKALLPASVPSRTYTGGLTSAAMQTVDWEGRKDRQGNLMVYDLPSGDMGGSFEVAGINNRYHPEMAEQLKNMAPLERGPAAAAYIAEYTSPLTSRLPEPYRPFFQDLAFNRGMGGATRFLQRALGVPDDGVLGPKTLAALEGKDPTEVMRGVSVEQFAYEKSLAARDPSRNKFLRGLQNRIVNRFRLFGSPAGQPLGTPLSGGARQIPTGATPAGDILDDLASAVPG